MLNPFFSRPVHGSNNERQLIKDLVRECIQINGREIYYIPRQLGREDKILGEDSRSIFKTAIPIEMYVESILKHDGEGDILTKFGLEIRDQFTFSVSIERFEQEISSAKVTLVNGRPNEGDLLYFDLGNPDNVNGELYEILFVEHEQPHYQISDLTMYKLKCEKFKYSNEVFQTGIPAIDSYGSTVGVDSELYQLVTETGNPFGLENDSGSLIIDTDWHNEVQERPYAENDIFQQEAEEVIVFTKENPFGNW